MARRFLTAEWRDLLMINYAIDPAVLEPLRPEGTELDRHDGIHYVSMVGFRFLAVRVLGIPPPLHTHFDEVNLRFYVRRKAADGGWRRAAVFVKEIVPQPATAFVARAAFNEPYVAYPMRRTLDAVNVRFDWRRAGRWESLGALRDGPQTLPDPDSEEAFITEHYWGYVRQRNGRTKEYAVHHPRWTVGAVRDAALRADTATLYGAGFAEALSARPRSAFVANGSAISIDDGVLL
jgi:uncharacterized protein YqjF (DUF2071 family)